MKHDWTSSKILWKFQRHPVSVLQGSLASLASLIFPASSPRAPRTTRFCFPVANVRSSASALEFPRRQDLWKKSGFCFAKMIKFDLKKKNTSEINWEIISSLNIPGPNSPIVILCLKYKSWEHSILALNRCIDAFNKLGCHPSITRKPMEWKNWEVFLWLYTSYIASG